MKMRLLMFSIGLFFSSVLDAQLPDSILLEIVKQQLTVMIVPDSTEKDGQRLVQMFEHDPCFRTANNILSKVFENNGFQLYDFREALILSQQKEAISPNPNRDLFALAIDYAPVDVVVYLKKVFEKRTDALEHRVSIEIRAVNKYTAQSYATIERCFSNWMRVDDCSGLVRQAFRMHNAASEFSVQLTKRFLEEGKRGRTIEVRLMPTAGATEMATQDEEKLMGFLEKKATTGSLKDMGSSENIKRAIFRIPFYMVDAQQAFSPARFSIELEKYYQTIKPEAKFKRTVFGSQIKIEIE